MVIFFPAYHFNISKKDILIWRSSASCLVNNNCALLLLLFLPVHALPSMHLPLLLLLIAGTAAACLALTNTLHGFRGCAVREFSFVAQKPGCRGVRVTTEACWGRCHTWEVTCRHPPWVAGRMYGVGTAGTFSVVNSEKCRNTKWVKLEENDEYSRARPKPQGDWRPVLGSYPHAIVIRNALVSPKAGRVAELRLNSL